MDGAASEAVRGLKAEKDSDLALIWEALSRRFGFVDEPERAMRRFDVRKQLEGETLAVFEQSLRMLHREAWPKTNFKSPEDDSLLRRKFIDGILDLELQRYLRLHATSDDFATTVSKARQFVDANELSRTTKKSALRITSPSVNYQSIVDGVLEALARDRDCMADVNAVQASGHGWIAARQRKGPLITSPHRRDGRNARLVRVFRRRRREANGCQGKGADVLVPRPRATQATGCPDGGHLQATEVVNRRSNNSIRRGNSVGVRAQPTSSHQQLLTRRHLVDAMSAANGAATLTFMAPTPCHPRHHRLRDASSEANGDVTQPAIG